MPYCSNRTANSVTHNVYYASSQLTLTKNASSKFLSSHRLKLGIFHL
jgi:hypothetical protein